MTTEGPVPGLQQHTPENEANPRTRGTSHNQFPSATNPASILYTTQFPFPSISPCSSLPRFSPLRCPVSEHFVSPPHTCQSTLLSQPPARSVPPSTSGVVTGVSSSSMASRPDIPSWPAALLAADRRHTHQSSTMSNRKKQGHFRPSCKTLNPKP